MFYIPVNHMAVFISAIISTGVGFVWYSPRMFAKPWMKYSKIDAKKLKRSQKHMGRTYGISFIATLIMAYALALCINAVLVTTIGEGLLLGSVLWLGFVATTMVTGVLFQDVPWKLFLINSGYQLASILVMSIILSLWI